MRTLSKSQDLWDLVVEESIFSRIAAAASSNEVWTILKTEFQGSSKVITVKLQSLRRDFETSYMKHNESVQEYLAQVSSIVSQMRSYGEKVTDEAVVAKVLRSLDPKFHHVVAAIEESKDLSVFSFNELLRGGFRGPGRGRNTSLHCSHCKKYGHSNKFCWSKPEEAKYAEEEEEESYLFIKQADSKECVKDIWYIDSGCSHHMTGNRSKFERLDESEKSQVHLGDDKHIKIEGRGLKLLRNKHMVNDLPDIRSLTHVCEGCALRKQAKSSFPVGKSKRANDVLELIHADLSRPMKSESLAGTMVEKQSGKNVKVLRTNRGGEFLSMEFTAFYEEEGIKRELTAPYTPEQNGIAKRKNQTVVEMARSMMKGKGLPGVFWAECVATATLQLHKNERGRVPRRRFLVEGETKSLMILFAGDPITLEEAFEKEEWIEVMKDELVSMHRNQTWELVDPPEAFLNGDLQEEVYVCQPHGFENLKEENKRKDFCWKGFSDSDWAGSMDDRQSTPGSCFVLGSTVVSWSSKKQATVALSTIEAEYIDAATTACQAIWLRKVLGDLGEEQIEATEIMCDNKSAVMLARNPVLHARSKHIEIKYHFIRELIEKEEINLEHCKTKEQMADIMTKSLAPKKHEEFCSQLGVSQVCPNTSDPKLVRINTTGYPTVNWEVEVFMLSTRVWKSVSYISPAFKTYDLIFRLVFVNGFIYWPACDNIQLADGIDVFYEKIAVLWNSSVGKAVGTTISKLLRIPDGLTFIGFGVCPNTSDPKLVRINTIGYPTVNGEVEVFMLSTRVWKSVSYISLAFKTCDLTFRPVFVNGFIYWPACDNIQLADGIRSNLIISFELKSDEFREVCLPDRFMKVHIRVSKTDHGQDWNEKPDRTGWDITYFDPILGPFFYFRSSAVEESIFSRIAAATSSNEVWTILKTEFQGSSKVSSIVSQMRSYGEKVTDEAVVEKMLRSLDPKFHHVVAVIEGPKDLSVFSFDELMGSLQAHEVRINRSTVREEEKAFQIKGEPESSNMRSRGRGRGDFRGHGRGQNTSLHCSHCITNMDILISFVGPNPRRQNSSCSHHMTGNRSKFERLDESEKSQVRLGDDKQIKIEGRGLKLLRNKHMVNDLPDIRSLTHVCEGCALGKQAKSSFSVGKSKRANDVLELIHADLYGPMKSESLAGSKYFLLFIDDHSRMSWVYFLKQKSESLECFKKFKAMVEKQSGKNVKVLRTDQGGKFLFMEFTAFCEEEGIKRELIAPYTPEQNGIAERKNRTVVEMARSMMKGKGRGRVPRRRFLVEGETKSLMILFARDPITLEEAFEKEEWIKAMKDELVSIHQNQTWELVDPPEGKNVISLKWVFKTKFLADGSIQKHKARLVVRGCSQQEGVDFEEIFALVARFETQPRFENLKEENKVYRLKKALYGLKQAPRAWYNKIDTFFHENGFERSQHEPTLYIKDKSMLDMTDLGELRYFLGLEISQTATGIFMCQIKYIEDTLKKFSMRNCKIAATPMNIGEKLSLDDDSGMADSTIYRSLVGRLIYVTHSRPDIAFLVGMVSRFMHKPSKHHFGFSDSDWAGSMDDRRSTSGSCFVLGSTVVSWSSKKQATVALSTTEAEYVAAATTAYQVIWLRKVLGDLGEEQIEATEIMCDNKSAVILARNSVLHARSKHIEIKHHFIRELIENEEINLEHYKTEEQMADIMTKSLAPKKHEEFFSQLVAITISKSLRIPDGHTFLGFGVSPNTSDPKLVRINTTDYPTMNWEVEVFMLSTRVWKSMSYISLAFKTFDLTFCPVFVNGFIYWPACDNIQLADGI
nr:retrovirus-related Pol polyprotein from transposon TNT 1-94 [Tanacetum cinerariifolium]